MGGKISAAEKVQPREFAYARNFYGRSDSESSDYFKTKTRSTTDICFLLFLTIFLIAFLCLLGYCIYHGDIYRVINGYDNCGNVCRRENFPRYGENRGDVCEISSKLEQPFHIVLRLGSNSTDLKQRKCVSSCYDYEGFRKFFHRCIPLRTEKQVNTFFSKTGLTNFFDEVSEDFDLCWKELLYLGLISLAFSIVILVLLRYLVGLVVWIVLLGVVLACTIGSTILWLMWDKSRRDTYYLREAQISDIDNRKTGTYLALAIIATIITIAVIILIIFMRKRIQLVVALFKEAGKAVASMPLLLLQPLATFLSLGVILFLWFYFVVWIESSGYLTPQTSYSFYYKKDGLMKFTRWYNLFAMLWMTQFVIGCQHMIIAGAVSEWYFTRQKENLSSPIYKSAYNLVRYHLGSVAIGSFLIALVQIIRMLLAGIQRYLKGHQGSCVDCALKCCNCCLYCFEKLIKYWSRNAYIEVAMFGYSFCRAGRQAFRLLVDNALRVAAINSVGDFVLFLGKVLVVIATVLVGVKMLQYKEGVQHFWVPLTVVGLFAYLVSHCFMSVYEMAIDTTFLCFCEDCLQNDGVSKPYFMSRGLMEFVENSQKALKISDLNAQQQILTRQPLPTVSACVVQKAKSI